jgi:hypothetical protein
MISAKEARELVKASRFEVIPTFEDNVNYVLSCVEKEIIDSCRVEDWASVFDITTNHVPSEQIETVANAVSDELVKLGYTVSIEKHDSVFTIYSIEVEWPED